MKALIEKLKDAIRELSDDDIENLKNFISEDIMKGSV